MTKEEREEYEQLLAHKTKLVDRNAYLAALLRDIKLTKNALTELTVRLMANIEDDLNVAEKNLLLRGKTTDQ